MRRRFRIDAQHFDFNCVARVHQLARMLNALGPAHLGNVDQTLDTIFEFNERAVISNAGNASRHSRADRKAFFNTRPGIGQQLFVTQRDALALAIKLQDLDLNRVANSEKLARILQATPRHVSHMQQAINSTEIDERAVVSQVLNLTFDHDVFFDVSERLAFPAGVLFLDHGLARQAQHWSACD